jgi:uncharacterized membrane protein YfcA
MDQTTILLVIIGLVSGVISGLTGLSSAGALIIGLTLLNTYSDYKMILGTVLYSILPPVTILGFYEFYKRKQVDFYAGNILIVTTALSTFVGAYLTRFINQKWLYFGTSIMLLISAITLFLKGLHSESR